MLEFEVMPERALSSGRWELTLGMPLPQAIAVLQLQCTEVKSVQLTYNDEKPLDQDVVLDLVNDGVRLFFEPRNQRLKIIEVYDINRVRLKYCNNVFCAPGVTPTLELIRHCFGPTRKGDVMQQLYLLLFRGVVFVFPLWNTGNSSPLFAADGIEFSEPSIEGSLVLTKLRIFSGSNPMDSTAPSIPVECYHGNCFAEEIEGVRSDAGYISRLRLRLRLMLADGGNQGHVAGDSLSVVERTVSFGESSQDIMTALGAPGKVFYKDEDKMRIHASAPDKLTPSRTSDYFFNYFTLGLDVLIDGTSHRVKKFVMHTNHPGHYDFNSFNRCNFVLEFPVGQEEDTTELSQDSTSVVRVTPFTRWGEVDEHLSQPKEKPVVLSRSSSTNSTNPFGYTHCYGHENVIFEVMKNKYIASVTIYDPLGK